MRQHLAAYRETPAFSASIVIISKAKSRGIMKSSVAHASSAYNNGNKRAKRRLPLVAGARHCGVASGVCGRHEAASMSCLVISGGFLQYKRARHGAPIAGGQHQGTERAEAY